MMSSQRSQSTPLVLMLLPTYLVLESVSSSVPSSWHFQTTHEAFIEAKMSDTAGVSPSVPSLTALTGTRSQASRTEGEKGRKVGEREEPCPDLSLGQSSQQQSPSYALLSLPWDQGQRWALGKVSERALLR